MKWVTREFVHVDRTACPWLIRRFIDPEAEFIFVPTEINSASGSMNLLISHGQAVLST